MTDGLRKRVALLVVRLFIRLGLVAAPYGDWKAADGRRDPSRGDDAGPDR